MGGFFFEEEVSPDPQELVGKQMTPAELAEAARRVLEILENLPEINREYRRRAGAPAGRASWATAPGRCSPSCAPR